MPGGANPTEKANMKKTLTIIALALASAATGNAQEVRRAEAAEKPRIPDFYLDYAAVMEHLFAGKGKFDELMELARLNKFKAEFLAKFWRTHALFQREII